MKLRNKYGQVIKDRKCSKYILKDKLYAYYKRDLIPVTNPLEIVSESRKVSTVDAEVVSITYFKLPYSVDYFQKVSKATCYKVRGNYYDLYTKKLLRTTSIQSSKVLYTTHLKYSDFGLTDKVFTPYTNHRYSWVINSIQDTKVILRGKHLDYKVFKKLKLKKSRSKTAAFWKSYTHRKERSLTREWINRKDYDSEIKTNKLSKGLSWLLW